MLHVVGNLCRDTTLAVDRFPDPGETLVARDSRTGWGGKGLNQAVAAARAGADVVLHAALGAEDAAALQRDFAGEERLVLRLARLPQASDGSVLLVRPDGENVIVSATACARAFDPLWAIDPPRFEPGDTLLMQGNLLLPTTAECLDLARRQGARTVLNPSPLWDEGIDWRLVDLAVLNRGELRRVTGTDDAIEGARHLRRAGAGTVVVTLGAHGALLLDQARSLVVPAPSVEARDTSGAGDVFCGVLVAHLGEGVAAEAALARATAAAALSVTRAGALASCPTVDEFARCTADEHPGLVS